MMNIRKTLASNDVPAAALGENACILHFFALCRVFESRAPPAAAPRAGRMVSGPGSPSTVRSPWTGPCGRRSGPFLGKLLLFVNWEPSHVRSDHGSREIRGRRAHDAYTVKLKHAL